jgi:hypothetical protein
MTDMIDKEIEIELLREENDILKAENHTLKVLVEASTKDKLGNHHYKLDNGFNFFTSDPNLEKHKDIIEAINGGSSSDLDQEKINASHTAIQKAQEVIDSDSKSTSYHPELREEDFN